MKQISSIRIADRKQTWTALGLLAVLLCLPTVSRAVDPVEKLKTALKDATAGVDAARRDQIKKSVDELKTINQLRRAYFLKEWAPLKLEVVDPKLDIENFRTDIKNRLVSIIRDVARNAVQEKDADRQIAVARMIAELAESEQTPERSSTGKFASVFLDVLIGGKAGKGLVDNPDIFVRQCALDALGKITPKAADAKPVLRAALQGPELGPRRIAAYALTDLVRNAQFLDADDELETIAEAVSAAVLTLRDPNEDEAIRGYCIQTIHASAKVFTDNDTALRFEKEGDKLVLDAKTRKILQGFQDAAPRLLAAFKATESKDGIVYDNLNIRLTALNALSQIVSARIQIVRKLYENPDKLPPAKTPSRSELLASYKAPDPIEPLLGGSWVEVPALLRRENDVRLRRGAMALLEMITEDVEHALVTRKVEKAITPEARRQFVRLITAGLYDSDRFVRWSAARTIRFISFEYIDEEIVLGLGHMLIDPADRDHDLSAAAGATLESIAGSRYAPSAVRFLKSVITDPEKDVEIREAALKTLVQIGGPAANEAFPEVASVLTDSGVRIRRLAAETLGILGQPPTREIALDALAALKLALRDDDPQVRHNASEAILSIRVPR